MGESFTNLLRLAPGIVKPTSLATGSTPGFRGGKKAARKRTAKVGKRMFELQERLYAGGASGDRRRILVVLQGMDTAGKGGTISHVAGLMNPQGLDITSFKVPTVQERAHDFLWRIRPAIPSPGIIGVFDRSHYEDVLVVRVHELAPRSTWAGRYQSINNFEADLVESGVTVIKCFLHVSPEVQRKRLLARLDDPTKYWKYKPGDVDERGFWGEYAAAYDDALVKCSTQAAPWHVIPSDHKWYRNLAVAELILERLEAMDLSWPGPDFDPEAERARLHTAVVTAHAKGSAKAKKPKPDKPSPARPTRSATNGETPRRGRPSAASAAKKRRSSSSI